jgi:putative glycosyltransferase (TIGR04372 family)
MIKLCKKFKTLDNLLPTLTVNKLSVYFPNVLVRVIVFQIILIVKFFEKLIIIFLPTKFASLVASVLIENGDPEKAIPFIEKAELNGISRKAIVFFQIEKIEKDLPDFKLDYLKEKVKAKNLGNGIFETAIDWGFWNLSHSENNELLEHALMELNQETQMDRDLGKRLLPNFTSNMGHLGFLTSYLSHYSTNDPKREIVLWPDYNANNYFTKLILDQSPLKITCISGKPSILPSEILKKDTLVYSFAGQNKWRIEHSSGSFSKQNFSEVENLNRFNLEFPIKDQERCIEEMTKIGFNKNKWFVCLHIRGASNDLVENLQARDSEISNYVEFIDMIYDLGGQVVRMGNPNFKKLNLDSRAIDYAHSEIRSDVLDCWLWSRCLWWTGNSNGASLAAYAFGAQRLITDQWFWDSIGPKTDYFMPKLASKDGKFFSLEETVSSKFSRRMTIDRFTKAGITIHNNPPELLALAALEMYESVRNKSKLEIALSPFEIKLNTLLRNNFPNQTMRLPSCYQLFYQKLGT